MIRDRRILATWYRVGRLPLTDSAHVAHGLLRAEKLLDDTAALFCEWRLELVLPQQNTRLRNDHGGLETR